MNSEIDKLKAAIAEISEKLKGPMPNLERAFLVEDRSDLREKLAKLEGEPAPMRSPTPYDNRNLRS